MGRGVAWSVWFAIAAACSSGDLTGGDAGKPGAVRPVRVADPGRTAVGGDLARAAVRYARGFDADLGLSDLDELAVRQVRGGAGGHRHVRLAQLHQGLPVWGADLVVHADPSGRFVGLSGGLAELGEVDVSAALTADQALAIGRAAYARPLRGRLSDLATSRESAELVVYPGERDARAAWHVQFFTELQAGIEPGLWNYFIDAKTGAILHQLNALPTEQASGPGGNPKVTRAWTAALDVEADGPQFAMNTARLITTDMAGETVGTGTIVVGPLDPFGDAAINDAHGFAEVTLNMMDDWYSHDSIDDNGFVIRSRVHYGVQFENAFWDGVQMTYGDGFNFFHPLSGDVDVVGHEINHGFTTFHSNLIYAEQSGGVNESFSDIAGTLAEFFAEGNAADFDMGRDIFQADSALRFMCDPTADGLSIEEAGDFVSGMDVHFSSGVMNKAFCLSARRLAGGGPTGSATQASARRAGAAWYEANASYWTASTSFTQACDGVLAAAAALGFSAAERGHLSASWEDVGVECDAVVDCDETLTAEAGTLTSPNFPGNYPDSFDRTFCIRPASGGQATLAFSAFDTEPGFDFVRVRSGTGLTLANTSGATAPSPTTGSLIAVSFTSDSANNASGWSASWTTDSPNQPPTVEITEPTDGAEVSGLVAIAATASDSDGTVARVEFQLPGGDTIDDSTAPYEVSWNAANADEGGHTIGVRAFDDEGASSDLVTVEVEVPCTDCAADAGPGESDDDDGGGGGCTAAGSSGPSGGLLVALLVALARRRRGR
jgi:Zn-dependent metalloprotease